MDLCGVTWPTKAYVASSHGRSVWPWVSKGGGLGRLTRLFINATGRVFATHTRFSTHPSPSSISLVSKGDGVLVSPHGSLSTCLGFFCDDAYNGPTYHLYAFRFAGRQYPVRLFLIL